MREDFFAYDLDKLVEESSEAVGHKKVVNEIVKYNNSYEGVLEERKRAESDYVDMERAFGF
jgi:hypothetical protein